MYRFQTLALLAGLALLLIFVSQLLFGPVATFVVAVVAFTAQWLAFDRSHDLLLWMHRARELPVWQAPQLHAMTQALAARAGIDTPRLMVFPSQMPNAFALSGRRRRSVVAVSDALVRLLPGRELQGVLAHEVAHLRNRDSFVSLAAGILVQLVTFLSQAVALLLLLMILVGAHPGDGVMPLVLLFALAPTGAVLLQAGLMRTRERLADAEAAELTGDPRALASALWRLQQYTQALGGWLRRFRFIYTSEPDDGGGWFRTHPPTGERVQALLEMAGHGARPVPRPAYHLVA